MSVHEPFLRREEGETAFETAFIYTQVTWGKPMLSEADQRLVQDLKNRLKEVAGERLKALIAYGSRAWGAAGPESDLDLAALVSDYTPELEAALAEAAYQVMWEHDFTPMISLKVFDTENFAAFQERGFAFYRKVAEEGIAL
jgi:predicted nucleotidyltransferase